MDTWRILPVAKLASSNIRRRLLLAAGSTGSAAFAAVAFSKLSPQPMDAAESRQLVERCLPKFQPAGLPPLKADEIKSVQSKAVASLWAGMGNVYKLTITRTSGDTSTIMAKRVVLPPTCDSIGDQRKKDSYDVEAAFYSKGHAEKLIGASAIVPYPLHVEATRGANVTICMTALDGRSSFKGDTEAFVGWLARLHATYWGPARADAAVKSGLQAQGCYWHLDTRPDEHKRMGSSGWMGRLKLAARAIDERLKADPMQTVTHGDAKGANILYMSGAGGVCVPLVYDFQYCGKACAAKDLAYFFNVEADAGEEEQLLTAYHAELTRLLEAQGDTPPSVEALRTSHELALCDWRRFSEVGLGGWGDGRANRRVQKVLDRLDGGTPLASEQAYVDAIFREFPV